MHIRKDDTAVVKREKPAEADRVLSRVAKVFYFRLWRGVVVVTQQKFILVQMTSKASQKLSQHPR